MDDGKGPRGASVRNTEREGGGNWDGLGEGPRASPQSRLDHGKDRRSQNVVNSCDMLKKRVFEEPNTFAHLSGRSHRYNLSHSLHLLLPCTTVKQSALYQRMCFSLACPRPFNRHFLKLSFHGFNHTPSQKSCIPGQ